eukprot:COSAG01_NODE_5831_length_4007_cov_1.387410_3_plen_211_part_00
MNAVADLPCLQIRAVSNYPVRAANRLLRACPLKNFAPVFALFFCKKSLCRLYGWQTTQQMLDDNSCLTLFHRACFYRLRMVLLRTLRTPTLFVFCGRKRCDRSVPTKGVVHSEKVNGVKSFTPLGMQNFGLFFPQSMHTFLSVGFVDARCIASSAPRSTLSFSEARFASIYFPGRSSWSCALLSCEDTTLPTEDFASHITNEKPQCRPEE